MNTARFTVAAVACLLVAACGDPQGTNANGDPNNANNTNNGDTSGSNNTNNTVDNNESNNSGNGSNNSNNSNNNNPTNNSNNTTSMPMGSALAVTADFASGTSAWHAIDLAASSASENDFGSGDLGAALGELWAYVIDRNGAQVLVLDPADELADLGIIDVSGVGTTNPLDATDAGGKAYISLYNAGEIAIATPNGSDWDQSRLDLFEYQDDSNPEPSSLMSDEGFVLAVLQRLDENFVGVESSLLLVIDSSDDGVVGELDLGAANAQAGLRARGAGFAVGITGAYGANDGGILGIERNAAGDYVVGEMLVTEDELGGDLLDFVFVTDEVGYAVITLPDFSSELLRFDASGVETVDAVAAPGFGGLDVSADGAWLAVGEREVGSEAFSLFDLGASPLAGVDTPMTMPPAGFVFLP